MSIELTPRGTRGTELPRLPAPLMTALGALGVAVYRRFGARIRIAGLPLLLLTTVGAKSGQERRTLLGRFVDNGAVHVIASAGGSARHPGWYHNMAVHPEQVWIEMDRRKQRVRAESLRGAERDAAWQRLVAIAPRYRAYEDKTDREIPIVRLTPVA